MRSFRYLLLLLPLFLALTACDSGQKPAATTPPPANPPVATEPKETVGGDLQSVINYGTGATQVKAYKKATKQIEKISTEQNKALEEALQP